MPRIIKDIFIGMKVYGHDTAVFIIDPARKDIYAISMERITRYKHDHFIPTNAFIHLLDRMNVDRNSAINITIGISCSHIMEAVADFSTISARYMMREFLGAKYIADFNRLMAEFSALSQEDKKSRLCSTELGVAILLTMNAKESMKMGFCQKISQDLAATFKNLTCNFMSFDHELCHAVSSLYTSEYDDGLLIVIDGEGDDNIYSRIYMVDDNKYELIASSSTNADFYSGAHSWHYMFNFSSIGFVYSWFTKELGYGDFDEGKVEALAAYGQPIPGLLTAMVAQAPLDLERHNIDINPAGMETVVGETAMAALLTQHKPEDLAATVQAFLEEVVLGYVRHLIEWTGKRRLMLSGGVFANVILNLKIFETLTPDISIVPAMADDGTAQGAAILALQAAGYTPDALAWMRERRVPYFGTSYSRAEIEDAIAAFADQITVVDLGDAWPERVAELVVAHKAGSLFHGRMEWGPRALGNRSIIADPTRPEIKDLLNGSIKRRPWFQPFCPSILIEEKDRLFEAAYDNRHMTCAFRMRPEHWQALPGAIHVDGTARAQFVTLEDNSHYYRVLRRMKALTGYGVLINTSFNKHGRTIVESPHDALTDFIDTDLPFLCIEGLLITRKQPPA